MSRVLLPALLTAALLAGGCGAVEPPPSAAERDDRTPGAQPMEPPTSGSPSASPGATASASPKPSPLTGQRRDRGRKIAPTALPVARPDGSRGHLLAADTLPAYAEDASWTVVRTGPERTQPVGACQKATFVDIGALHAVRRGFTGPEGSGVQVRQVVARFADAKSAWRAHQVLRSWRDECVEWLDAPKTDVSPMEGVDTDAGTAAHYRAVYGPKKDVAASGLGIVRQGRWLSIVALGSAGDDYWSGWTRRAVRRIAATF